MQAPNDALKMTLMMLGMATLSGACLVELEPDEPERAEELEPAAQAARDEAARNGTPMPTGPGTARDGTPLPSLSDGAARDGTPLPSLSDGATDPVAANALAGCTLFAEQPYWAAGAIYGAASWSGCPASAGITVVLRHDRSWWPDRTLASRSGSGSFGSIQVSYPCGTDFDPIKVFIEIRYGGAKVQSPRAVLPCG